MKAPGLRTLKKLSWAIAATSLLAAAPVLAQQASINLLGSSMSYCNTVNNTWDLTKTVDQDNVVSGTSVTWTVTATKNNGGPAPDPTFCVEGTLVINNAGAGTATIGNIVVNAQRRFVISGKQRWVSASADIADKVNRDLATQANIVAAGSQEDPGWNAFVNSPATYTTTGGFGTFTENAASGSIEFADGDWNDVLANNAYVVGPGATVTLQYKAFFNGALLNIDPLGDHLRTEVLVTFANAGARGGSGASLSTTDITGDGVNDGWVRTVPVRASLDVPPLEQCNDTVTMVDVMDANPNGVSAEVTGGTMPESMTASPSATTTWTLITTLTGEGTIENDVTLTGTETACCDAANAFASALVTVTQEVCTTCVQCPCGESEVIPGRCNPCSGDGFCTFTQGKYNNNAGNAIATVVLPANYATIWSAGLRIGSQTDALQGSAPWTALWTPDALGLATLQQYIGGNTAGSSLGADLTNPATSADKGLGSQTLALTLSIGLSGAGVVPAVPGPFANTQLGNVVVCPVSGPVVGPCPVPTLTMSQILGIANALLSGGTVSGWDSTSMRGFLGDNINPSFDDCVPSAWALTHTAGGSSN